MDGVLAGVPLFVGLDDESGDLLASALTTRTVVRGHVVFSEGESGDRLFVVLDGKVKISRAATDGRENLLAVLGPGEMFGELSLFDPGPRTATATAVAETQVVSMGHDQLKEFLSTRPGTSENTRSATTSLALRSRTASWLSSPRATAGRPSSQRRRSSCESEANDASVTAVTVAERGPGSKRESSPNIWPGPRIASRFSRPSEEVRPSFTLPSVTM